MGMTITERVIAIRELTWCCNDAWNLALLAKQYSYYNIYNYIIIRWLFKVQYQKAFNKDS